MERLTVKMLDNVLDVMGTIEKCCGGFDDSLELAKYEFLKKLRDYMELDEQGKLLILAYEIVEVPDCPHCGHTKWKVKEVMIQPRLLDHSIFFKTQEEAEAALKEVQNEQ